MQKNQKTTKKHKNNSILNNVISVHKVEELSWGLGCQSCGFWYDDMRDYFEMHLQCVQKFSH